MSEKPVKLVGFLCNWCSYAGADLAGVSRLRYDTSIRIVRIPCSGRADPLLALLALQQGADGVLVSGCHPGDCHYSDGNFFARRRFAIIHDLMDFLGMDTRILQLSWVSASEGKKWADVVNSVAEEVRAARDDAKHTAISVNEAIPVPQGPKIKPLDEDPAATEKLQKIAQELLSSGKVKAVLGHTRRKRNLPGVTAAFISRPEDVKELLAFTGCVPNLSRYLKAAIKRYEGPVAMVGKGSDLLSVINLEREHQIPAGMVRRLALSCKGLVDPEGRLLGFCANCLAGVLGAADFMLGESPDMPAADDFADVRAIEALPREVRAAYWDEKFATCLRCYACRNACPSCFCKTCFAESRRPTWVFPSPSVMGNKFFHLIRAYHLAGRCSMCGECERVCPMALPLRTLARKAAKIVQERFGLLPSSNREEKNALSQFKPDEQVEFIR